MCLLLFSCFVGQSIGSLFPSLRGTWLSSHYPLTKIRKIMSLASLETRKSGYFFDGDEGESICVFLSRRLPFFSKSDFCVIRTQMITKISKLLLQAPAMMVKNHMSKRVIPGAPLWWYSELYIPYIILFSSSITGQSSIILAENGIIQFLQNSGWKCLKLFGSNYYAYI